MALGRKESITMAEEQTNDPINFSELNSEQLNAVRRVASIQRTGIRKLQHQGMKLGHLLSVMHGATGSLCSLKAIGVPPRGRSDEAEDWKDVGSPGGRYDGGADAALDSLIAGTAERMLKIIEDDEEWSREGSDALEENLAAWAEWERVNSYEQANAAKANRRPCVLHTIQLYQKPDRGLWFAVMVPFNALSDAAPVIGVGASPVSAMGDFDRAFGSGELNPAALLWLEDQRRIARAAATPKRTNKRKPRKES